MAYDEVKEFKPKDRLHALTLGVYTDGRECLSWIPNPRSYAEEGGPEWIMRYSRPTRQQAMEIAGVLSTLGYLLSPEYTVADAMKRLRELRAAYRDAITGAERTKVSSQASGQDRVEPKQKLNPPSNGDEQP